MGRMRTKNSNCGSDSDDDIFGDASYVQKKAPAKAPKTAKPQPVRRSPPAEPEGTVSLSAATYLELYQRASAGAGGPAEAYVVLRADYAAEQVHDSVQVDASFRVKFLTDEWSCVRILPDTVSVTSHSVHAGTGEEEEEGEAQKAAQAELGLARGHLCLYGKGAGSIFTVEMRVRCPFQTSRATSFRLAVPHAVHNALVFRVPREAEIKVESALRSTVCFLDADLQEVTETEAGTRGAARAFTQVDCELTPTSHLSVQWKQLEEEKEKEEAASEAQVVDVPVPVARQVVTNATQLTVHSIGEGVVQSSCAYSFEILHGSRNGFEFRVPKGVRVLSVQGTAIKRWDVVGSGELKVWLEYAKEHSYSLVIEAEYNMRSTSCEVEVPRISCLRVNRERGHLGVEARTNVEVSEVAAEMVSRVGIGELPVKLATRARNPLLFGYKFLSATDTRLVLDVKKHKDSAVLVASVDQCKVVATVADDKVMYRVTLQIRNTQTQFIRLSLPEEATVWSTMVADSPVKPARDQAKKQLMIPLEKSSAHNEDAVFSVEVVFLVKMEEAVATASSGKLRLMLAPAMDIPINVLLVSLFLPIGFHYGEFDCPGVTPVRYFSAGTGDSEGRLQEKRKPKRRQMKKAMMNKAMSVTPVRVSMPTSGEEFRFEQLLVLQEEFSATVYYEKKPKEEDVDRTIGRCRRALAVCAVLLVAVVLIRLLFFVARWFSGPEVDAGV